MTQFSELSYAQKMRKLFEVHIKDLETFKYFISRNRQDVQSKMHWSKNQYIQGLIRANWLHKDDWQNIFIARNFCAVKYSILQDCLKNFYVKFKIGLDILIKTNDIALWHKILPHLTIYFQSKFNNEEKFREIAARVVRNIEVKIDDLLTHSVKDDHLNPKSEIYVVGGRFMLLRKLLKEFQEKYSQKVVINLHWHDDNRFMGRILDHTTGQEIFSFNVRGDCYEFMEVNLQEIHKQLNIMSCNTSSFCLAAISLPHAEA